MTTFRRIIGEVSAPSHRRKRRRRRHWWSSTTSKTWKSHSNSWHSDGW
ncbi:hypothetical protein ACI78V_21220 [Geodermatophilus sp. SYSU D00742]